MSSWSWNYQIRHYFCLAVKSLQFSEIDKISLFSSCHEKEHDSGVEVYGYHSTIFEAWLTQLKETVRLSAHGSELIQSFMASNLGSE